MICFCENAELTVLFAELTVLFCADLPENEESGGEEDLFLLECSPEQPTLLFALKRAQVKARIWA